MRRNLFIISTLLLPIFLAAHEGHDHGGIGPGIAKKEGPSPQEIEIRKLLDDYRQAMESRSVEKLSVLVASDLLVLEGVHKNVGWADYRDNHIGPEMKEWKEFKVQNPKILTIQILDLFAYVVQEANYEITALDGQKIVLAGAETLVVKNSSYGWKIKHIHFSSKKLGGSGKAHKP